MPKLNQLNDNSQYLKLGLEARHLAILFFPVLTYVALTVVLHWISGDNAVAPPTLQPEQFVLYELGSRIYLLALSSLFLIICAACVARIAFEISTLHSADSRKILMWAIAALVAIAIVSLWAALSGNRSSNVEIAGLEWFRMAAENSTNNGAWSYTHFDWLLNIVSVAVVFTVPVLIVGRIACLDEHKTAPPEESWRFQVDRFQTNIFMSTAVLVVGVLLFKTWTHHPAFLAADPEHKLTRIAFENLAGSLTTYMGMIYSLLLAAYALPVAYLLSRKADAIAFHSAFKGKTKDAAKLSKMQISMAVRDERKNSKLVVSAMEILQTVIAVLAPLLTGAIASMFNALS